MERTDTMTTIKFEWNEFVIASKFDVYRKLLDSVVQQMEKDLMELAQRVEGVASQPENDPRRDDYRDYLAEEHLEIEGIEAIFLHAFFASSFALFEHELVRVCERARRETYSQCSVQDLGNRDYMNSAKEYLKKLGMGFPAGTLEWKQATDYRKIRNKIMHAGSGLGEKDDVIPIAKANGILRESSLTYGVKQFELHLTKDFCNRAMMAFRKVLIDVVSAYRQWKEERLTAHPHNRADTPSLSE